MMTRAFSPQIALLSAVLCVGLMTPLACSESTDTFPPGTGAASGACVVDGMACPHGCDENLGCVDCALDADCGSGNPVCVVGDCEECGDNADCPTGQSCFPEDHECAPSCQDSGDCDGDAPICDPDTGACVGCQSDADCGGDEPFCSDLTKQCVECELNADCGVARPICDVEDGECRQCMLDGHCPAAEPFCDDHECTAGTTCDPGTTSCGDRCVDTSADPDHCGGCGESCGADEYCDGGSCACRPSLTAVGADCVDLDTDPDHCGSPDNGCDGATPVCEDGACVAACSGDLSECDGACVDVDVDPAHCGSCGDRCDADQLCIEGGCEDYQPATGCNSCPCSACGGDFSSCCSFPGDERLTICLETEQCP